MNAVALERGQAAREMGRKREGKRSGEVAVAARGN